MSKPTTTGEEHRPDIDSYVNRLRHGERTWGRLTVSERQKILRDVVSATAEIAEQWVETAAEIKQIDPSSSLLGEEWLSGPYALIGYCQALRKTLSDLDEHDNTLTRARITRAPGDRLAVRVLPYDMHDKLLMNGFHADIWTRPGVSEEELRATSGLGMRQPQHTQGIALVLGAGNIFSIPVLDVIYQLFAENRAVILKLNPVTDPLMTVFRSALKPFIEIGVVEIVTGGTQLGEALTGHPGITAVHMTGSEATHDAVVWGAHPGQDDAKTAGLPKLNKPMTSELGGVAPIIVVPGTWSSADLRYQAEHVATMRLHNSGCNCIAGQILIISSEWKQKHQFLTELRRAFENAPSRSAWYPGSDARVQSARELHPSAENPGDTPTRTLIHGLDITDPDESAFTTEYFAPVLGIAEVPGTASQFFNVAVSAANQRLHGTLGANIIAHPQSITSLGEEFWRGVAELKYGTVAINAWTGLGFATARASWGAYPGHTLDNVQSGIGVVHNALLLDHIERTVISGPFRPAPRSVRNGEFTMSPKPPWFVTNRTSSKTSQLLTRFVATNSWRSLPSLLFSALRG